ncbi:class I SAM-dependent DNA methyltransferase [Streptomyces profundus]|uniref:class I SAM-dependent DNA methyltransferase n=1 Tax=Streptomyces profundus TaxID=2867410 RepID=UPI001D161803|nr:class I SAM-dependent methyltransferase [Streptomyces sp. MA3_2.13]UED87231.1 class I SAM-dependent methyltransferase [Streptomyces sp. MA3_2.13]
MADHQFADADLAALYDRFHPWESRGDSPFYLPRVLAARAVLDIGCGTGMLLHRARDAGHTGRLCGLDPAVGMLEQARRRTDVEWVQGDLETVDWHGEFDLAVMTGHAFQVLVDDEELRAALAAVRQLLTRDGRFAFETRNPAVRVWERWTPENGASTRAPDGALVRMEHRVLSPAPGEALAGTVTFSTTFSSPDWPRDDESSSTLRFLDVSELDAFLAEAGLEVAERYGDWDGNPFDPEHSPEIIVFARRSERVAP